MKILITGGAGFIGSNIVDRALSEGYEVIVIDNYYTGSINNLIDAQTSYGKQLTVYDLDIRDMRIPDIFLKEKPDCVFHLAAQIDVRKSVEDPVFDADVNITGSLNIIEAAVKSGVKRFIFTSSGGAVYSEPQYLPVDEKHAKQPLSPYGISKKAVDDYLVFYGMTYEMSSMSLALGNVYGPRQDPYGEAGVIAIFTGRMLDGQAPTINGDGEQLRDYVFVSDVVDAFISAKDSDATGFVNIGTGVGTSVNNLYEMLAQIIGFDAPPSYGPAKPGEMRQIYLDCNQARAMLGWQPLTSLEDGLKATVEYFRST